jgi:prepilin-type N-terminal cleavage/methylation domain-containing protein
MIDRPPACALPARRGFTLLEMLIVISLMIVMAGVGVLSFAGFDEEGSVRKPGDELIRMSKQAVRAAAVQSRPFTIQFTETGFGITGFQDKGASFELREGTTISIMRWGEKEWLPAAGQSWMFGANGLCDPLRVRIESVEAALEMTFNALTGSATDQKLEVR